MSKLYCCNSLPLRDFLKENGIEYELVAENRNSHRPMWIYVKDEKLNKLLKEWSLGSKS